MLSHFKIVGITFALLIVYVSSALAEVYDQAEQVRPLLPGMAAPKMRLLDPAGKPITVAVGKRDKPVVVTFFRGGWCPYCNVYLANLRKAENQLKEMGFDVWFISPDKPELLQSSLQDPQIGYTLYSDASMSVAESFGIAFKLDKKTFWAYRGFGINVEEASGYEHRALPVPATFIIGKDGLIHFQFANADYKVRLPESVLLAAAKSYTKGEFKKLKF